MLGKKVVSDWRSGDDIPSLCQMYERDTSSVREQGSISYNYFDGFQWRIGDDSPNTPVSETPSSHQNLPWREITK